MNTRFGAFEVDLDRRRLLKRGVPIALREQSFQVLAALMEHAGEIVTREELRRRLWASDTFVDFEVALNSAVSRLRDALGDSAECPSFIETIPKRGYRFVVPIPKRPAVAVMPFANQTADAKDDYLSDGLTDELIRVLSRIDGLKVTAGSVVFRFKGQRCDARQVGRELGVEAVLEGSVSRAGDRIRITVNLVGVKDGFNLWAQRFDGNLAGLFAIQDEVCGAVAEALHIRLASQLPKTHPSNANAYMQHLKGTYLLKRRRPDGIRRAFEYLQEAIRLEPDYAEPYYGAAMFYIVSTAYGAMPPRTALPEAEALLLKGLALDENSATLHSTLGMLRMFQWRWAESEQEHRRAINLEPGNAFPHMCYPILCSFLGRHEEAVFHAVKAVELDPLDLMTNFRLVQATCYARRYEEAVRAGRIAIELTPDSPYTYFYLALSLAALGSSEEAWDMANAGRKLAGGMPLGEGYFGYLAGALGHATEARTVIRNLQARREQAYSPALPIVGTYLGLGETADALSWLQTALTERDPFLGSMMVFPAYDRIRDHLEFKRVAGELKLSTG
ncbi:MAG: winged helix-turn-helix domain-containing protein [Acidobacteriaceae bacterium]|nr:winged helix-turn-helix domain-containing protein [Acidobacteriaceae bacterium]MBV8569220.1 winged helix-turn-helix domain-containing protein [Acidobacteriaceae bacterium]